MTKFSWPLILIGIILFLMAFSSKKDKVIDNVFFKKDYFITVVERDFFDLLQRLLPTEYICYPQIVLSAIVSVKTSKDNFWKYQNSINRKIIDFVIFKKSNLEPVLAIEYDDSSHNLEKRIERDNKVDNVLKTAGISYIHVHHSGTDLENMINTEILTKLK
jgi:very-short-patch-repair endonuclease